MTMKGAKIALRMPMNTNRRESLPTIQSRMPWLARKSSLLSQLASTSTSYKVLPDPAPMVEQVAHQTIAKIPFERLSESLLSDHDERASMVVNRDVSMWDKLDERTRKRSSDAEI